MTSPTHHNYQADLANADQIARLVEHVQADFDGRLDILVHNAAAQGGGRVQDFAPEQWRRMLDVNLTSAYLLARALLPAMPRGASIVNIASGAGHDPMAGLAGYGASKAGLIMFTADLAQDVGPEGIRANVVSPGGTDTSPEPRRSAVGCQRPAPPGRRAGCRQRRPFPVQRPRLLRDGAGDPGQRRGGLGPLRLAEARHLPLRERLEDLLPCPTILSRRGR